jgi:hypothetical protein
MPDILNAGAIFLVAAVCLGAVVGAVGQLRDGSHAPSLAGAADPASAGEASPSEVSGLPGLPLGKHLGDAHGDKQSDEHSGRERHDRDDGRDDDRHGHDGHGEDDQGEEKEDDD